MTRRDWEISQVGLSFEHGGSFGSATLRGPILLASHAGMFVRMFSLTKDSLVPDHGPQLPHWGVMLLLIPRPVWPLITGM